MEVKGNHGRSTSGTARGSSSLEIWRRLRLDNLSLRNCVLAARLRALLNARGATPPQHPQATRAFQPRA